MRLPTVGNEKRRVPTIPGVPCVAGVVPGVPGIVPGAPGVVPGVPGVPKLDLSKAHHVSDFIHFHSLLHIV